MTARHIYFLQCSSFDEVDLVDPEARGYLLQCSLCGEVDLLDPEARVCLVSLVVGALI